MKQYEIKQILSGIAQGRYAVIINGWQIFETFRTEDEALEHIEERKKLQADADKLEGK